MLRFFPVGQYEEKMLAKNVAPPLIYFLFSTIIFVCNFHAKKWIGLKNI